MFNLQQFSGRSVKELLECFLHVSFQDRFRRMVILESQQLSQFQLGNLWVHVALEHLAEHNNSTSTGSFILK